MLISHRNFSELGTLFQSTEMNSVILLSEKMNSEKINKKLKEKILNIRFLVILKKIKIKREIEPKKPKKTKKTSYSQQKIHWFFYLKNEFRKNK